MAAYVVLNIDVINPEQYAEYVKVAGATVERYGGRYLVRGGKAAKLEGSLEPKRLVVLEFPSLERANAWWESAEYRAPKAIRQQASISDGVIVEGV
jgi:uncharacterized protein (DUF1330 family)